MKVCGIDSIPIKRQGKGRDFICVLGCAIAIENLAHFNELYNKAMEKIFKEMGLERKKKVYSSYCIQRELKDPEKCKEFYEKFMTLIKNDIKKIRIFLSLYPGIEKIYFFGEVRKGELAPADFIERHVINSYPHVCAWKFLKDDKDYLVASDSFSGYETEAWREIEKENDFKIYVNGDQCFTPISTADIFLKLIEQRLSSKNLYVGRKEIKEITGDFNNVQIDFLGAGMLPKITPRVNRLMKVYKKLKHPVIYLLMPHTAYVDKKTVMITPNMIKIQNYAHKINGCVKFFSDIEDREHIEAGDIFVYFDDEGKKACELLKNSGYNITIMHIKQTSKIDI